MHVDLVLLVIVLVMAVSGYRRGFLRQVFQLAGVVCVAVFSLPLCEIVEKILLNEYGIALPGHRLRMLLMVSCGSVIYILCHAIGRFLHKTLVKGIDFAEKTNRILGAVAGMLSSVVILYFILGIIASGFAKVTEYAPKFADLMNQSVAFQTVSRNNIVEQFDYTQLVIKTKPSLKNKVPKQSGVDSIDGAHETDDIPQNAKDTRSTKPTNAEDNTNAPQTSDKTRTIKEPSAAQDHAPEKTVLPRQGKP